MSLIVRDEEDRVAAYAVSGHPPHANEWHFYATAFLPAALALNRGKLGLVSIVLVGIAALCIFLGVRRRIAYRRTLKGRAERREVLDHDETRKLGSVVHSADAGGLKLDGLATRTKVDKIAWSDLRSIERDGSVLVATFDRAPIRSNDVRYARRAFRAEFDSAPSAERFRQLVACRFLPSAQRGDPLKSPETPA